MYIFILTDNVIITKHIKSQWVIHRDIVQEKAPIGDSTAKC